MNGFLRFLHHISDHLGVSCILLDHKSVNRTPFEKIILHTTMENLNEFREKLRQQNWEAVYRESSVDSK